jgi:pimeloyl-ACP methyl ester carboxylesterase
MSHFIHDGITFHFRERGEGMPFVFQHGLGGDTNQIFDLFMPPPGIRLITLDCRAHGGTQPFGDEPKLGFDTFADDVVALLDHLGVEQVVMGGISMGAGVALNLALRHTARVKALVLSRPAWLDRALPSNLLIYPAIALLIRTYGVAEGRRRLAASAAYELMFQESPDAAASLLGQFDQALAADRVARLERMPVDRPCADLARCGTLAIPVLVLGNHHDPIHPFEMALQLVHHLPQAQLKEVTAKSVSKARHQADVQAAFENFLNQVMFP